MAFKLPAWTVRKQVKRSSLALLSLDHSFARSSRDFRRCVPTRAFSSIVLATRLSRRLQGVLFFRAYAGYAKMSLFSKCAISLLNARSPLAARRIPRALRVLSYGCACFLSSNACVLRHFSHYSHLCSHCYVVSNSICPGTQVKMGWMLFYVQR